MHIILTGPTGLVGTAALSALLRTPSVTRITIFSRRLVPLAASSPKCTVIQHPDFAAPPAPEHMAALSAAHGLIWALGISATQVSPAEYDAITLDYPLVWARALAAARVGAPVEPGAVERRFVFVYVSGEGATAAPGLLTPRFGRVKGAAEARLLQLGRETGADGFRVYAARPGAVDSAGHGEVEEYAKARAGVLKRLEKPLIAAFRVLAAGMMAPTRELGDALVKLATGNGEAFGQDVAVAGEGEGRTIGNRGLRRLAGL